MTLRCRDTVAETVRPHLWSIVLAGGDGERIQPYIRERFGRNTPKQYCSFVGTRSLLQHTIDRADRLSPATNRVLVAASHHRRDLAMQMKGRALGTVLFQPVNRGTAVGLFFALAHVLVRDPDATVVVYPSDHFVYPESAFLNAVSSALTFSRSMPERPLLLGVRPQSLESDYGWIQGGRTLAKGENGDARSIARFVEKPSLEVVQTMKRAGGMWNTSILIARLMTLWRLGSWYLPRMMASFEEMSFALRRHARGPYTEMIYRYLEPQDLSRDLLEPATKHLAVMESSGFFWSDWGRPARIQETLACYQKPLGSNGATTVTGH